MARSTGKLGVVSSLGDVRDTSTWSGTPARLVNALSEFVEITQTLDVSIRARASLRAGSLANLASGFGTRQPTRAGMLNAVLRRRATDALGVARPGDYLHFGLDHFPLRRVRTDQRHFLFTDYSRGQIADQHLIGRRSTTRYRDTLKRLERDAMQQFEKVFVTSTYVGDYLREQYNLRDGRVVVVGSGFRRVPNSLQTDRVPGSLIFVGRASFEYKGGALLVAAFPLVQRQNPTATLTLVASRQDPQIRALLPIVDNNSAITLLPNDTSDILERIARADLFCAPAPCEPWGLIYLESLGVGTPILGLNCGAVPEFTRSGRYGALASSPTPMAVAQAITDALSDRGRLREMGEQGKRYVTGSYSWQLTASRIIDCLGGSA